MSLNRSRLSLRDCDQELEEDDISFDSLVVRNFCLRLNRSTVSWADIARLEQQTNAANGVASVTEVLPMQAEEAGGDDIIVTDGTFSELLPMQTREADTVAVVSSEAGQAEEDDIIITDGTFSGVLPIQEPGPSSERRGRSNMLEVSSKVLPIQEPGPSSERRGRSNVDEVSSEVIREVGSPHPQAYSFITDVGELDDGVDVEWGDITPDFTTAITSTPRRYFEEDGPVIINLGLMRDTIIREKREQKEEAKRWYLEVRTCLAEKIKPYSKKLNNRGTVLSHQITEIRRQREALDKLLASLERERGKIDDNIDYLVGFKDKFPFPKKIVCKFLFLVICSIIVRLRILSLYIYLIDNK